ncbi:hypothetical protein LMG28138_03882 [Pararobbsia alpina]|uniref:Uncharacterized protein n=1 Tax=Pararobbsia alpina TaxID=621374 RepID=A0A6S7D458_9BURK|nr:hypothetical protein LMG28138_03882 [Pararobbsia alpina]
MAGLQVFGPDGRIVMDTPHRLGRVLGAVFINGAGSLINAALAQGTPFVSFSPSEIFGTVGGQIISPTITFSGTVMSWTYPAAGGGLAAPAVKNGWAIYGIW